MRELIGVYEDKQARFRQRVFASRERATDRHTRHDVYVRPAKRSLSLAAFAFCYAELSFGFI